MFSPSHDIAFEMRCHSKASKWKEESYAENEEGCERKRVAKVKVYSTSRVLDRTEWERNLEVGANVESGFYRSELR